MPVADLERVDTHTGNGSSTNFAYGFRIFADADLTVKVDDVLQVLTTDYTVNGAGDAGGGSIDFVTAPINLSVVTISGELPYDRKPDYVENGNMRAQTFDDDFDRAVMLIQQNRRDIYRAIKIPIEETTDQEVSSTAAERADKILAFDSSGLPVALPITDLSSTLSTVDTSLVLASSQLSVAIPNRQAVAGGTVDAITATFVPTISALANNIECIVEASGANATTTPTFAPDGLTAKTIVKGNDVALAVSDIHGANYRMHLVFDATLDKWILLNPASIVDLKTAQTIAGKKTFSNNVILTKGADIASATALPVITDGNYFDVTGTTSITSINTVGVGAVIRLHFDAILTLVSSSFDLVLPGGANITTAAGDEATFIEYASGDWRCTSYQRATGASVNAGASVQVVNTQTGIVLTGTTTTPDDDTIPQITEGDEYMTLAITPTSINNRLRIVVVINLSSSVANALITALFQDATANALTVASESKATGEKTCISFSYEMVAGTVSSTTFRVRAGAPSAGTTTFNGDGGTRKFGGVLASSITITEIQV